MMTGFIQMAADTFTESLLVAGFRPIVESQLNGLWQSLLLVAVIWLVLRYARRISAATRHTIWAATLAAAVAIPFLSGMLASPVVQIEPSVSIESSVAIEPSMPIESPVPVESSVPIESPVPVESSVPMLEPTAVNPSSHVVASRSAVVGTGTRANAKPQHRDPKPGTLRAVGGAKASGTMETAEPAELSGLQRDTQPLLTVRNGLWLWLAIMIWAALAVARSVALMRGIIGMLAIKRRCRILADAPAHRVRAWSHQMGIRRDVRLAVSDEMASPAVLGLIRPVIVFPERILSGLSGEEFKQISLHELAHIQRYDDWVFLGQKVLEALLFFNPAVLIASRQMTLDREIACDDWVVAFDAQPRGYASCLSRLVTRRSHSGSVLPVPGAALSKKQIIRRVQMLLDRKYNANPKPSRMIGLATVGLFTLVVLQAAFTHPVVAVSAEPTKAPAPPAEPAEVSLPAQPSTPAPPATPTHSSTWTIPAEPAPAAPVAEPAAPPSAGIWSVPAPATGPAPAATPAVPAAPAPEARSSRTMIWAQSDPLPDTEERMREAEKRLRESEKRLQKDLEDLGDIDYDGTLSINRDDGEFTWIWNKGRHRVHIEAEGTIAFNAAGDGIESISDDGFFLIEEREGRDLRGVEIMPGREGGIEYYYFEGRDWKEFDASAQRWLKELLPDIMRRTGLGADTRVTAILAESGPDGVLREISRIESDYVKRIYFEELVKQGDLDADHVRKMFRQVGREMDSDYEKAELLIKYARYTDQDTATQDAFIEAVGSLDSDYEIRRVLSAMGTKDDLEEGHAEAVLKLAMMMDSDYEKAELLLELADHSRDREVTRDLYMQAVAMIDSDYEKRRVLEALLMPRDADPQFVAQVLDLATTLDSDWERAELLIRMSDYVVENNELLAAYVAAAEQIDSDYEKRRVISEVALHDGVSEEVLLAMLGICEDIDSDYEKAEFLIEHGEFFMRDDAVQDQVERVVDSIDSDYERDRVYAELYRLERRSKRSAETY